MSSSIPQNGPVSGDHPAPKGKIPRRRTIRKIISSLSYEALEMILRQLQRKPSYGSNKASVKVLKLVTDELKIKKVEQGKPLPPSSKEQEKARQVPHKPVDKSGRPLTPEVSKKDSPLPQKQKGNIRWF